MDNYSSLQLQCLEMTTKRKLIGRLVPCRCFRGEEEVISVLDYSHCSLQQVPKEIFSFERTLEELYLDANQIEELPKQLFNCQALKKLSMPDNDLSNLPTTIGSLVNLKELDISKNGIQEFPDNIKCCKCLSVVEASVNPIAKLPDGFTQLLNLTQLFLNDAFLEYLPANFGRLSKLRILELRENHLKTMPKSIHRLSQLERLDLGSNEFSEMPEVLEQIHNLKELWLDNNSLQSIPGSLGKLRQLRYLDLAKNRIESLDTDVSGCESLEDLLLSSNMLQHLPDSIGMLKKLTTLKVDDNQLTSLPNTIGSLSLLEEFDCSCNELESLPPTIGYLTNLRTFAADENFLTELPREIGNCRNVTVMSLRSNKLEFLPDEIGQMTKLRVLNLSDNRLKNLPFTFTKLKDLAALWLSDNQSKALIPLQTEAHPETKQRVLTNYMFPQQPRHDEDYQSDTDSFNPTLWEEQRQQRMTVAFEFEEKKEEEDNSGKVKVEINLKRYPTPYPEDLKNMVKSVQSLVGKSGHQGGANTNSSGTNMEHLSKEQYEPPWPLPPKEVLERDLQDFTQAQLVEQGAIHNSAIDIPMRKDKEDLMESSEIALHGVVSQHPLPELPPAGSARYRLLDSMGGSPNDIRISDMRPTLVDPPMYKPKVVLLGKDKKESTDDSEADKMQCVNHSGSSATYSDYSPSQGSSGSSNPPPNTAMHTPGKDGGPQTHWTNRLAQSFPKPLETKPLLSQRETPPSGGTLQQRGERRPLSDSYDSWGEVPHYDNTGFVSEEAPLEPPAGGSAGNPMLGSKPRSASTHGRRPLMRQERIVGVPLDLEQTPHAFHNARAPPDNQVPPPTPANPWQNWTRTPSPFEDRTAFPSRLDPTPSSSPRPDRKDFEGELAEMQGPFPSAGNWSYLDPTQGGGGRGQAGGRGQGQGGASVFAHGQPRKDPSKVAMVMSKSSERLSPMMKEVKAKFKKSQSIDEMDMGSYKIYSIPMDSYSSSIEHQGSVEHTDMPGQGMGGLGEQSMSRSQSAPMLDDDLDYGASKAGQQKPAVPKKVYHFDQSFNPQGPLERRAPPPFPNTPEYANQPGKTLPKELISPRGYRGYPPLEMFSFAQSPGNEDNPPPPPQQQPLPSQRSRPGFLRRADSLVSSTELALFRRVQEAQDQAELYARQLPFSSLHDHNSLAGSLLDAQPPSHKRNGRYEEDYSSYQEQKKPVMAYPTKSLTQRRPLSARSYSTETYGASQARPVSARPTMAALLEKMPPDYNLSTCTEKGPEPAPRAAVPAKPEDITSKMPVDWRQQLLRHIESKRLDRSPSQQGGMLDNGQEGAPGSGQWAPYSLGRRDVPPEIMKKLPDSLPNGLNYPQAGHVPHQSQTMIVTSASATPPHRSAREQQYEGAINKISIQQYQAGLPMAISPSANPQYQPSMTMAIHASNQYQTGSSSNHPQYQTGPSSNQYQTGSSSNHPQYQTGPSSNHPQYQTGSSSNHPQYQTGPSSNHHQYQTGPSSNQYQTGSSSNQYQTSSSSNHPQYQTGPSSNQYQTSSSSNQYQTGTSSNQYQTGPSSNQYQTGSSSNHPQYQTGTSSNHPQYQKAITTNPRPQSARCLLQTKGQKSMDGFQEQQLCVRIEKNPGLGFSISGGLSGQGNPFKPSDLGTA
ncbi:leucine-rich repeat-containing protein 7 isoform X2 [Osmerus eperlanus]|uniref:leucine-rich repeat-containing protein 7 isoform X2 n=1 Tax=Osmerus eperlanus TaxID=29151 RepID=UPI002E13331B